MIIFSIIILLFIGCAKDPFEPNDSISESKPVEIGVPFKINMYPAGDIDYFKTTVLAPGFVEFTAGIEKPANLKLEIKVYDENGKVKYSGSGLPLKFPITKGELIFSISSADNITSSKQTFPVVLNFKEVILDGFENNDEPSKAKKTEINKPATINIFPPGDIDFFKVSLPQAGNLIIEYDINKPVNLQLIGAVYNENGAITIPDTTLPIKAGLQRGIYTILIRNINDLDAAETEFNLNFKFNPVVLDRFEPNDDIKNVKKLNPNTTVHLNIFPIGDNDYFKLLLSYQGILRIESGKDQPSDIHLTAKILNSNGEVISGWTALPFEYEIKNPDYYYVVIADEFNDNADENIFALNFKFSRSVK